ncbi:tyrosinase family oxidase copper chaperone [Streptomyces sp. NPDC050658]|uniref:tyrosinase family oxidase copper chaperone n=1 Tax=unclassified Streptomyces TaxID=2593676 RepID=UPI00342FA4F8
MVNRARAVGGLFARRFTRRGAARNLIGVAVAAVGAQAALFWATRDGAQGERRTTSPDGKGHGPSGEVAAGDDAFDEVYEGRRIRGSLASGTGTGTGTWVVTVDGRPLHLMRRADGGYLSMIDHYQSFPTPLLATRGAVDELGRTQQLRTAAV